MNFCVQIVVVCIIYWSRICIVSISLQIREIYTNMFYVQDNIQNLLIICEMYACLYPYTLYIYPYKPRYICRDTSIFLRLGHIEIIKMVHVHLESIKPLPAHGILVNNSDEHKLNSRA